MIGKRIHRDRDFGEFLKALRREGRPAYLPFYEHIASPAFISARMETDLSKLDRRAYWRTYADFWLGMGFDCVPMEISLRLGLPEVAARARPPHTVGVESEAGACVFSRADLDRIRWPEEDRPIDFEPFERVAEALPAGVKIVGGVCMGPFEVATQKLFGLVGLSYMMADEPDTVTEAFARLRVLYAAAVRRLAAMDAVGACRQGDDLGFKSGTFLPPDRLREWVFPTYRDMAAAAHAADRPFILHSCGNLALVYDDIIEAGVDAKHSFEDQILPVAEFKRQYGRRITPLGGLDVDRICRSGADDLRAYTRRAIDECFADGHWALGTGNSLTGYMPVENYLTVLEEGLRAR